MKTIILAKNFNDYICQSLYENQDFIEAVEGEVLGKLPGGRATVEVDYEVEVISYDKAKGEVTLTMTWTAEYEASGLKNDGKVTVLATFKPYGKLPAVLTLKRLINYADTFSN